MTTDLFAGIALGTDFTPGADGPDDTPPPDTGGGPTCEICGVEIPWAGRGRKPKRCQDHKTRTNREPASNDSGPSPRRKASTVRLEKLVGDLEEGIGELAGTIIGVAPVTGVTVLLNGPPAIKAAVDIAADHPRMLKGLETVAQGVPFIAVGKFVAALFLAIGVDMGRADPHGMAGKYLRVSEAADKVGWEYPQEVDEQQPAHDTMPDVPPPRFKL